MEPRSSLLLLGALSAMGCGGGGTTCMPETDRAFCQRVGKNCDEYADFDNCGTSRHVSCGTCELPLSCGGGGRVNVCGAGDAAMPDAAMSDAGPPGPYLVIRGTITNNPDMINGRTSANSFDPIEGMTIECRITLPTLTRTTGPGILPSSMQSAYLGHGPTVTCSGSSAPIVGRLADVLENPATQVGLSIDHVDGLPDIVRAGIGSPDGPEIFGVSGSCEVTVTFDTSGYPVLAPFTCASPSVVWQRFVGNTIAITDSADGMGSMESTAQ